MGKPAAEDNFLSAGNTGVKVNSRCVCVCVLVSASSSLLSCCCLWVWKIIFPCLSNDPDWWMEVIPPSCSRKQSVFFPFLIGLSQILFSGLLRLHRGAPKSGDASHSAFQFSRLRCLVRGLVLGVNRFTNQPEIQTCPFLRIINELFDNTGASNKNTDWEESVFFYWVVLMWEPRLACLLKCFPFFFTT